MKQIFTLLVVGMLCPAAYSQLVLNEIYTSPGGSKSEFFELYNTGIAPESSNNYTLVTYFRSSTLGAGFYVLDLPDITVAGKGFLVGSSKMPFSYQGVANSTHTNFSWNDNSWLCANEGSLTAWKSAVNNLLDGNLFYDKVSLSGSFNDLFCHLSGNGSSYVVFLFKNGVLVNSLIAGSGGQQSTPSEIAAMPTLNITMLGAAPSFNINFAPYSTLPVEPVNEDAGSDNGYMRTIDGACGKWTKSSNSANHTPQMSNGSTSTFSSGIIEISSVITRGTIATGSIVTYKVVSAPTSALPVTMYVYMDNGNIPGELDVNDVLLTTTTTSTVGQSYQKGFFPYDQNILVVAKNGAGCVASMKMASSTSILPIKLTGFAGNVEKSKAVLYWTAEDNETGYLFEVQSSNNGKDFATEAIVFTTTKAGTENYSYKDSKEINGSAYYRLKVVNKDNSISYSKIIRLTTEQGKSRNQISLLENPVASSLQFNYTAMSNENSVVTIYSISGVKLYSTRIQMHKGVNSVQLNLNSKIATGTYLLEIINNNESTISRFIKK